MEKLMLAMSGGVDSSVALLLLKDNFEVLGVTLRLFDSDILHDANDGKTCCSLSDTQDAAAVAARFNIPHYVYNFKERFEKEVIARFNAEYLAGGTPNPCVDCNMYIKFGALLERAVSLGCERFATGHYARTEFDESSGRWLLKKALSSKDQSYVLYGLTQEQLSRIVFPLGALEKSEVRALAEEHGLVNRNKPDSQDICFVPSGDYAEFIEKYTGIKSESGFFCDKNGKNYGRHKGIIHYTKGQRRGLGISYTEPLYVVALNAADNTVIIGTESELYSSELIADKLNWISVETPRDGMRVRAKTRYSRSEQPCVIEPLSDGRVRVVFDEPQKALTPGQRVVFYDGDIVVGGGTIV